MVLTMKLTTFAWNVWDGRTDPAVSSYCVLPQLLFLISANQALDKWQLQKCVMKYPTLLEFLGYSWVLLKIFCLQMTNFLSSFYFPGVLVGPYLDFASYMSLIDESLFKSAEAKGNTNSRRAIPDGRKRVAYRKMLTGLVFLGSFVVLGPSFYFGITVTPWFITQGFLYRSVHCTICDTLLMYSYEGWHISNSVDSLSGPSTMRFGLSQRCAFVCWHKVAMLT